MTVTPPPRGAPTPIRPGITQKDAGDEASAVKFRHGADAVLVCILADGQYHVGFSAITPQQVRDMACSLIHTSFIHEARLKMGLP